MPDQVSHGTANVYISSYRCQGYLYELSGSFLVGPRVWHGSLLAHACYSGGQGGTATLPFTGSSSDGYLSALCVSNVALDPFLQARGAGRGALACVASVDGGTKLPLALELQTHVEYVDPSTPYRKRTGTFYGA